MSKISENQLNWIYYLVGKIKYNELTEENKAKVDAERKRKANMTSEERLAEQINRPVIIVD